MSRVKIVFKYRDEMSNWEWRKQRCIMSSVEECMKFYGFGVNCDYQILSVKECNISLYDRIKKSVKVLIKRLTNGR